MCAIDAHRPLNSSRTDSTIASSPSAAPLNAAKTLAALALVPPTTARTAWRFAASDAANDTSPRRPTEDKSPKGELPTSNAWSLTPPFLASLYVKCVGATPQPVVKIAPSKLR